MATAYDHPSAPMMGERIQRATQAARGKKRAGRRTPSGVLQRDKEARGSGSGAEGGGSYFIILASKRGVRDLMSRYGLRLGGRVGIVCDD